MTVAANRHKFHVHTGSGVDRNNCDTAAGHFDPAGLEVNGYSCDAASPQQCYAGDLSGKLGTAAVNGEVLTGHDDSLTIADLLGHSIVVHAADGGAARVGCADIVNTRGEKTWAAMGRVQVGRYVAVPAQYSRDEGRAACRTMGYHDLASIHSAEDQRNAAAACASILRVAPFTVGGVPGVRQQCFLDLSRCPSR